MTAKPAEAPDLMQVLKALNRIEIQQARMEQKLDSLTEPKGRLANIEEDVARQGEIIERHEKKINQARGGIAVIVFICGLFEALFHKVWR